MREIPEERELIKRNPVELTFIAKVSHGVNLVRITPIVVGGGGVANEIVVCVDIVCGNSSIEGFAEFVINARIIA